MSIAKHRELLALSVVRAHEVHGYALAEALEQGLGRSLGLKRPTVYAILKRFIDRGWVCTTAGREGPYPERQVCTITAAGRRAHATLLRDIMRADDGPLLPLVVQLAHLDELDPHERRPVLERLRGQRRTQLEQLDVFPAHEGSAGAALALMRRLIATELDAVEALLDTGD